MHPNRSNFISSNRILDLLSGPDLQLVVPYLEKVTLPRHYTMARVDSLLKHVYFPSAGFASVFAVGDHGKRSEAGMFGFEGMTPTAATSFSSRSRYEIVVQAEGWGHRIAVGNLAIAMERSPTIGSLILRYLHAFSNQVAYTALVNATGQIHVRLARWLLMSHDRIEGHVISITHDDIAVALGARRPGITAALHVLEGKHLVRASRGEVKVEDRAGLEAYVGRYYGRPEEEYDALLSQSGSYPLRKSLRSPSTDSSSLERASVLETAR